MKHAQTLTNSAASYPISVLFSPSTKLEGSRLFGGKSYGFSCQFRILNPGGFSCQEFGDLGDLRVEPRGKQEGGLLLSSPWLSWLDNPAWYSESALMSLLPIDS